MSHSLIQGNISKEIFLGATRVEKSIVQNSVTQRKETTALRVSLPMLTLESSISEFGLAVHSCPAMQRTTTSLAKPPKRGALL